MQRGATILDGESKVNRCFRCGGEKQKGRGQIYCPTCKKIRYKEERERRRAKLRHPCRRCGGLKKYGDHNFCSKCREWAETHCSICGGESKSRHCANCERLKCPLCGDDKSPGVGKRYCDECIEMLKWKNLKRKKLKHKTVRYCVDCKTQIQTRALKFCERCKAKREQRFCTKCRLNPVRGPRKKYCLDCYVQSLADIEEYNREYKRKRLAADPDYWKKCDANRKRTPETRKRHAENVRMRYRLKRPKAREISLDTYRNGNGKGLRTERLSVEPLIPFLREVVPSESLTNRDGRLEALATLAGMDASFVRRFMTGEHTTIRLVDADKLCMAMDLMLFEVYDSDIHVNRGAALDSAR